MTPVDRIPHLSDIGLLIGRVALGVVFVAHGWQKFDDMGHGGVTKMFEGMDIPAPSLAAYYSTWVELAGGLALIAGVAVPLAGLLLAADMAGAFWFVHKGNGVFVTENGFELVLVLGAGALLLALAGAGRFSLDGLLFGRRATERQEATT
ncbi:DoxX family protein [Actinomadura chibensis]|uniref:DoxX family protein n=1 Tax=Actinomadura chibensis TaxID=392828 RepID=A0A5D0NYY0_9ACTN|nr:DoxX family protein [Actinomadura chibensis]TYB49532.1 DoxX family protein [Actinomadura chibensis]